MRTGNQAKTLGNQGDDDGDADADLWMVSAERSENQHCNLAGWLTLESLITCARVETCFSGRHPLTW